MSGNFIGETWIKTLNGTEDRGDCHAIRAAVFQQEQHIDPELDFDRVDGDEKTLHKVFYINDKPVGTIRAVFLSPDRVKIGRLCVLKECRGHGIGENLMYEMMKDLQQTPATKAELSSQLSAKGFYDKLGFATEGEVYEEAGLPHVKMIKNFVK